MARATGPSRPPAAYETGSSKLVMPRLPRRCPGEEAMPAAKGKSYVVWEHRGCLEAMRPVPPGIPAARRGHATLACPLEVRVDAQVTALCPRGRD